MTSARIRPMLSDELLVALRGSLFRGCDAENHLALMTGDYADLYGEDWRTVTAQADEIGGRALSILEKTVHDKGRLHLILDGTLVAEALAVATDEVLRDEYIGHQEAMEELEMLGPVDADTLEEEYDSHLRAVQKQFVRNGLLVGKSRKLSRLHAMVSGIRTRGKRCAKEKAFRLWPNGRFRNGADMALELGIASVATMHHEDESGARDFEERLFGAAAFGAAFGFFHGWDSPLSAKTFKIEFSESCGEWEDYDDAGCVTIVLGRAASIQVEKRLLRILAPMTVGGAASFLLSKIMDPKVGEDDMAVFEAILCAIPLASSGKRTSHMSFGKLLGLRERQPKTGVLTENAELYDAAPAGEFPPAMALTGKNGREIHCRALVNRSGELVGYRAYDTLSREFTDEALHIVYDLAGRRVGHISEGRYVDGLRKKHVMTAPDILEPLAKPKNLLQESFG